MKKTLLQLLPAVLVAVLYILLVGHDQLREIRTMKDRLQTLGTTEEHELQAMQMQGEIRRLRDELDRLRAEPPPPRTVRPERTPSAALNEAHRRISAHAGARILGVFHSDAPDADDDRAAALLRRTGGGGVRAWSVSLEAPWPAMRTILADFAAPGDDSPVLVQRLSMEPGIGEGKPTCWTMTICQ